MNAYWSGLKIYEVIGYAVTPEVLKPTMGEQVAMVRFGTEKGTPFIVPVDEIVIE